MFRMGQQRRSVIQFQHRPEFDQPVQIGVNRRTPRANYAGICAALHTETRFLIGNRRLFDSCPGHPTIRNFPQVAAAPCNAVFFVFGEVVFTERLSEKKPLVFRVPRSRLGVAALWS